MDSEDDAIPEDTPELPGLVVSAGERLRLAREAKRQSLEHISAETRIPVRHLETIESGHFEELPARTYAIGFARTYARAVSLDEMEIADQVRQEMGTGGPRYSAVGQGMEPGDPAKLPTKGLAWFGGFAALVLVIGIITFASTYYGAGDGPASLLAEAEQEAEGAQEQGDASASADTAPADLNPQGQVVFTALEDGIWVRFYEEEGDRLFEAQMESGQTFELPPTAANPLINTGRPDAFTITIDGREVPKLADEPITMGDTPISAAALLARPAES
ncbi:MAG: RodZ domain-containing protein [Erythrobacter sp.]